MRRRRLVVRRPRGTGEQVAAAVIAVMVMWWLTELAGALARIVAREWPIVVAIALGAVASAGAFAARRAATARARAERLARLRLTLSELDAMTDQQFEYALRDLLIRDGCRARRVGQQGDQAADVIAQDRQRGRIVIQAKHTTVQGKVGSRVMYEVNGTAGPVHRADVAVVVTNGLFTRDAKAWGERHGVHWVDRDRLRAWAEDGTALHELLSLSGRTPHRRLGRPAA